MNEPIQKYFRLGTLQWMSYPNEEPLEALKKLRRMTFSTQLKPKAMARKTHRLPPCSHRAT